MRSLKKRPSYTCTPVRPQPRTSLTPCSSPSTTSWRRSSAPVTEIVKLICLASYPLSNRRRSRPTRKGKPLQPQRAILARGTARPRRLPRPRTDRRSTRPPAFPRSPESEAPSLPETQPVLLPGPRPIRPRVPLLFGEAPTAPVTTSVRRSPTFRKQPGMTLLHRWPRVAAYPPRVGERVLFFPSPAGRWERVFQT